VACEVVPGITTDLAAPAYAGIPVTLRHSSTSFTVVTGHEDPDKGGELDWDAVARLGGTIVILMGVGRLPRIVERLLAGGLPPDTPAAAVRWGTRPEQHTVRATLATIADHELQAPSVIVIGAVAATDLDWFESRPLFGTKVVVTRPAHQSSGLAAPLRAAGAEPVVVPTIEIVDPDDHGAALRSAVAALDDVAWVVLTSANGASRFCDALRDGRDLAGVRLAAIGPGTAEELARHHLVADLVPERYIAESLLEAFPLPHDGPRRRVVLARAAVARDVLPDGLRAMGWDVEVVPAYRTVPAVPTEAQRVEVAHADVVTFTSASTVDQWVAAFGVEVVPPTVACIGPVTADAARRHGLRVDVVADVHTIPGLVDALVAHVAGPPPKVPARRGGRRRGRA
jgi:uroporphyrinogen III methyltransferase/synthase